MKVKIISRKSALVIMGVCIIAACAMLAVPYFFSGEKESISVNAAAAEDSAKSAKDRLREFIQEHEQMRSLQLQNLDEMINSEKSSAKIIENAQLQKMEILRRLETESTIAGILEARGYTDAAVYAGEEYINIMIRSMQAQAQDISRILELVITQTDIAADNIKIIPIN